MTVLDEGIVRLDASRREWERLPKTHDACEQIIEAIEAEDREDYLAETSELHMQDDGILCVGGFEFMLEEQGLRTLLPKLIVEDEKFRHKRNMFPSALDFLLNCPPDERAWIFNKRVAECQEREFMFRTRTLPGDNGPLRRSVFATTGPKYGVFDADKVAQAIALAVPKELGHRADMTYDCENTSFRCLSTTHAPSDITDFGAGDAFMAGWCFGSNDSAAGALFWHDSIFRNLCLNFIVLSHDKGVKARLVHRMSIQEAAGTLAEAISGSHETQKWFAGMWGTLSETPIHHVKLWGKTYGTIEDALRDAVECKRFGTISSKKLLAGFDAALDFEPSETAEGFINAITRAAHTGGFKPAHTEALEKKAGLWLPMMAEGVIA
jgi:hypothetical protein